MDAMGKSDIYSELNQLKDLFKRRLLDDKVKAQVISELSAKLDDQRLVPLCREFILLLDRLEANMNHHNEPDFDSSGFIRSVHEEILVILGHYGLEPIQTSLLYDCSKQKIVSMVDDLQTPDMTVVRSVRTGYTHNGTVLRPEEVVVSKSFEVQEDVESECS